MPPKVSSPLTISGESVGSKETETSWAGMTPCENSVSVTVQVHGACQPSRATTRRQAEPEARVLTRWDRRACVGAKRIKSQIRRPNAAKNRIVRGGDAKRTIERSYPRIPSTPSKPSDLEAAPIPCPVTVRPLPRVTVSVNSVPMNAESPGGEYVRPYAHSSQDGTHRRSRLSGRSQPEEG